MKSIRGMNNKGYMLVEIILASAIAFGIAYFIIDLTIKIKNKNDDMLVESLVTTDKTIISNGIVDFLKDNEDDFDCNFTVSSNKIWIMDKEVEDEKLITQISDYITLTTDDIECTQSEKTIHIYIPLKVAQMPDKNFDIDLYYKLEE